MWSMNMCSHLALMAHCLSSELGFIMKTLQIAWSLCGSGGRLGGGLDCRQDLWGPPAGRVRDRSLGSGIWSRLLAEPGNLLGPPKFVRALKFLGGRMGGEGRKGIPLSSALRRGGGVARISPQHLRHTATAPWIRHIAFESAANLLLERRSICCGSPCITTSILIYTPAASASIMMLAAARAPQTVGLRPPRIYTRRPAVCSPTRLVGPRGGQPPAGTRAGSISLGPARDRRRPATYLRSTASGLPAFIAGK